MQTKLRLEERLKADERYRNSHRGKIESRRAPEYTPLTYCKIKIKINRARLVV